MRRVLGVLAGSAVVLGSLCGDASSRWIGPAAPLEVATVRLEQNSTDGDVEVVFEATGGDDGLAWLTISAPDGRLVVDFRAPDPSTLGMRQFQFESPEPRDPELVMAAYPEGVYTFAGATAAGDSLWSQATLSHRLPSPAVVLEPADGAENVMPTALRVVWTPVEEAAAYLLVIEQEEAELSLTARLEGGSRGFIVPDDFLQPGMDYQLAIGTVGLDGNTTFVERTFTTAGTR